MLETYNLKLPKAVYSGTDALGRIGEVLKGAGATKVAAFTDKGIRKIGLFDLVEEQIKASGIEYRIFDDLPAEPSYMAVQAVIDEFKSMGADFIVACGGGSVMDAAKLASVLVTDEYGVKELLDETPVAPASACPSWWFPPRLAPVPSALPTPSWVCPSASSRSAS